jgi:hypothetical protein
LKVTSTVRTHFRSQIEALSRAATHSGIVKKSALKRVLKFAKSCPSNNPHHGTAKSYERALQRIGAALAKETGSNRRSFWRSILRIKPASQAKRSYLADITWQMIRITRQRPPDRIARQNPFDSITGDGPSDGLTYPHPSDANEVTHL